MLGHLAEQDFDSIWNGPNALDLRRAMATWDYPSLCSSCRFTDKLGPEAWLPTVAAVMERLDRPRLQMDCELDVSAPPHRAGGPPTIKVRPPPAPVERWVLGIALGGEQQVDVWDLSPRPTQDLDIVSLPMPAAAWRRLSTNLGYWWALFAVPAGDSARTLRSREIRCLVRHERVGRVEGSTLRYPRPGPSPRSRPQGATSRAAGPRSARRRRARSSAHAATPGRDTRMARIAESRTAVARRCPSRPTASWSPACAEPLLRPSPRNRPSWWCRKATPSRSSWTAAQPGISRPEATAAGPATIHPTVRQQSRSCRKCVRAEPTTSWCLRPQLGG